MENTTNRGMNEDRDQRRETGLRDDQNIADRGTSGAEKSGGQQERSADNREKDHGSRFDAQNSGDRNGGMDKTELDITD